MTVFVNAILYYKGICICICICKRNLLLQSEERDARGGQRGRLQRVCSAVGGHHPEERPGDDDTGRDIVSERDCSYGNEGRFALLLGLVETS